MKNIYNKLELKDQLYAIFFAVSALLSAIGFILGLIFQSSFWMNLPHIIIILMCLILPIIVRKSLTETAKIVMWIVSVFYLPFVFFTNAGYKGATPIYLVMIIVYFAFHFSGKHLFYSLISLNLYYAILIIWSFYHPSIIVPYPDEIAHLIDLCVAVFAVSSVLVTISYSTFRGYKKERRNVYNLMEELKAQNKALKELSIRDQLTGVFTKKYFLDKLSEEFKIEKNPYYFYVLMVDVDFFKNINDTYGHLFGDEVLRCVAKSIENSIRSFDVVARYGGEEFIILLSHSDIKNGWEAAERIRENIEDLVFRNTVKVTASIGISVNCAEDTVEDIIERTDKELYKAKNSGRNKVCEWKESIVQSGQNAKNRAY
ncbi:hypothetical protein CSW98_12490 [Vibrio sp. HA2012]|uniref:GGDEF domain-containing protein n=1 Tax=Vibrio sp. HA2012 TaxID=1971595 RepID=UPI000C2C4A82|nr:GGDEF domain-containing protein [Vibrio sp. HA2012]PJC85869.1 hypothetical protein CSW98_12490 [Vibrio sp. HA2012]